MARARNIKPGYFSNDVLAECEPLARILFAGLWTIADRAGRLEDRPKKIEAALLPYDECDIESLLRQLANRGFIHRYESGGKAYIQICTWEKHQNPHQKEAASEIPPPVENVESTGKEQVLSGADDDDSLGKTDEVNERAGLIPDSGFPHPDSPTRIPGDAPAAQSATAPRQTRALRKCPAGFEVTDDMQAWAKRECPSVDIERATAKFMDYTFKNAMTDWVATWRNWLRSDQERAGKPHARASPNKFSAAAAGIFPQSTGDVIDV